MCNNNLPGKGFCKSVVGGPSLREVCERNGIKQAEPTEDQLRALIQQTAQEYSVALTPQREDEVLREVRKFGHSRLDQARIAIADLLLYQTWPQPAKAARPPFRLKFVHERYVDPAIKRAAQLAAVDVMSERGLSGAVNLGFVEPEDQMDAADRAIYERRGKAVPWLYWEFDDEMLGWYDERLPDCIFVRCDLDERAVERTTAHELFHLAEKRYFPSVAVSETLAVGYGSAYGHHRKYKLGQPWARQ